MKINSVFAFLWDKIYGFLNRPGTRKVMGLLVFFSITIFILFSSFSPTQVMLRPDEVAQRNIQSNINAVIVDEKQTEELRKQAESKVQKVYQEDKYAYANVETEINNFYLEQISADGDGDKKNRIKELLNSLSIKKLNEKRQFSDEELVDYILNTSSADLEKMRQTSVSLVKVIMDKPLTEETMQGAFEQIEKQVDSVAFAPQAREIMKLAIISNLKPNLLFNKEATNNAITEAIDSVQSVQKTIKAGEIIVREGDRVTAEQISVLEQLGIQRSRSYPLTILGSGLFVLLTFWLIIEFLRRYYRELYENDRSMLLIGLIFIIILLITRFITIIKISDQPELNTLMGYLAPVAAGSMLVAILLNTNLAYFLTMIMAIYVGLLSEGNQLFYGITAFVGGTVGVFQVHRLNQISDLARSGLYIALVNVISILTLSLISGNMNLNMTVVGIIVGAVNGILSAVLMIGALPYLETAFSITSMNKLLELSNPNHYLLKRLLLEAPGTYHHSLMVGNLAEASAESIGANPLMVRIGAYYHDIGKIKRPNYFVENQQVFENPHEKIAPALSALIITSHVKDGVELAREARLPQVIIDFIEQHHGTSLTKYFYSRALEEDRQGNLGEESFRYEGPKPQSREIALVMLADSVEAAVRSLSNPSPEKIRNMVRLIIKDKLNDGQLELCELTFRDLDTIGNSFCKLLEGVYHKRIEYPETIIKEFEKRREVSGNHDNQSSEQN
ncbi:MAG: HDIG domain-containing protein [Syntrophomonadaceae bacterium]|nr:HDIG domain-containing protein [Syntrophomonadaceae bacterium]MDD3023183.1 HDIG domain-containing protein [Syntrophomonadaceae bacterium]